MGAPEPKSPVVNIFLGLLASNILGVFSNKPVLPGTYAAFAALFPEAKFFRFLPIYPF